MKVLFVISSLNTGGAQRALSNIVTNLPDEWKIDILLNNAENITYPYRGNLIDLGIREPSNRKSAVYQLKVLAKRFRALKRLKRDNDYEACVSFLDSANVANIITGKKYCTVIISVRNYLGRSKSIIRKCINRVIMHLYNRADRIVALSRGVENDLARNFGIRRDKLLTIYNGFPLGDIKNRAGQRTGAGGFTFITIGRCEQQKGQWHLVRAFAQFAEKHPGSRLVILGDGPYVPYISGLVTAYRLESGVSLKGFVDNPFKELVNADVFVFPSLWEGFGNAPLEAMICGLPVILSDYRYGAREIIAPSSDIDYEQVSEVELAEFGVITPVCSGVKRTPEEPLEPQELLLLDAMERLYADGNLRERYRLASAKRAEDFSIDKCAHEWRCLIETIK